MTVWAFPLSRWGEKLHSLLCKCKLNMTFLGWLLHGHDVLFCLSLPHWGFPPTSLQDSCQVVWSKFGWLYKTIFRNIFFFLLSLWVFKGVGRILLCSLGWPWTYHCMTGQPPECWNYRSGPPFLLWISFIIVYFFFQCLDKFTSGGHWD